MPYFNELAAKFNTLHEWLDLKKEQGADFEDIHNEVSKFLGNMTEQVQQLSGSRDADEPDALDEIKKLRPQGPRVLPLDLTEDQLYNKMLGAWLGRSAGCILGIPVEGRSRQWIEAWAKKLGQPYPLTEYFAGYPDISRIHYSEPIENSLKANIDHVSADDDLVYSVLGLLILEEYGLNFTPENVGEAWVKYLPLACTAERVALENLKNGLIPPQTALKDNPYYEWIGADIRSDPWSYCAPGLPELAAEFAWRDATVSHIRNGIYGEMFFSAVIAAAFAERDTRKLLHIGLSEIPAKCALTETVLETIKWCYDDRDWSKTHDRVAERYAGMSGAHTLNNAAITIMGLLYGEGDFEKTISLAVMGGIDTDCNAATAGSIMGAIIGAEALPAKWTKPLGDTLNTYLNGQTRQSITDLARRCCKIAAQTRNMK